MLAVEGDSAFGFSGMEVETICRYDLPVCIVVFNNNGIYRGTDTDPTGRDPGTTVFVKDSRYDKMMEAFGGVGVHVDDAGRALPGRQRGDGFGPPDPDQRGHRPRRRHRERQHRQPQPDKHGPQEAGLSRRTERSGDRLVSGGTARRSLGGP